MIVVLPVVAAERPAALKDGGGWYLQPFLVLALTLVLVLTLDLAQITKPPFAKPPFVYSRTSQ